MKIILAPDSFKGTFSSMEVINYLKQGINRYFDDVTLVEVPIADGGEGTVDAILHAKSGQRVHCKVKDPLGRIITASYGIIENTAIIEMAAASGITLISEEEKNPSFTSTYGTGQMMRNALDKGVSKIVLGIGGSATNDGGIGMGMALGVRFFDEKGNLVIGGGSSLIRIHHIDLAEMDPRLINVPIEVICDVNNPLTGPLGATYTYGPQKGATPLLLEELELGMEHYRKIIMKDFDLDLNTVPGAGAAGGLGGGLVAFFKATLKPGIDTILDIVGFEDLLENGDMVITGEGKLDGQSIYGKVPVGVAQRCLGKDILVLAFVGAIGENAEKVYDYNIHGIFSTVSEVTTFEEIVKNKKEIMTRSIDRFMRLLQSGMVLEKNIRGDKK
ncbi:MAG: glycerate kinase [Firmicutes bacterium HGW-Firmicutes-3]|jgi:glycerate kinase|nr:MAG: glycerate kinase [Firmicutes bacterium HGW-Firmicutes-3]